MCCARSILTRLNNGFREWIISSLPNCEKFPRVVTNVLPFSALWSACEYGLYLCAPEELSIGARVSFSDALVWAKFVRTVISSNVRFDGVWPALVDPLDLCVDWFN